MAEDFGIQGRGGFYDATGTIRDVIQNHIFQVLCNLVMDPPVGLDSESIRDEKVKVLKSISTLSANDVVRDSLMVTNQKPGVKADSKTETFAAMRLALSLRSLGRCAILYSRWQKSSCDLYGDHGHG